MDYEWGVTFTGQSLLPIVVPLSWLPFMIRERFTSSLKTCWRLPNLFVPNRIMSIPTSYECQAYSQHALRRRASNDAYNFANPLGRILSYLSI